MKVNYGPRRAALIRSLLAFPLPLSLRTRLFRHVSPWVFSYLSVPTKAGVVMSGSTSDSIQRAIYYFREWEPGISRWLVDYLRPGDVFVDVGANIGYYSLLAASVVGPTGRVIAIEPSSRIRRMLEHNVAANSASAALVEIRPVAIGESEAVLELFSGPVGNLGATSLLKESDVGLSPEEQVSVVPLAVALKGADLNEIRIVKIDVEGFEVQVLRGALDVLCKLPSGAAIVVELNKLSDASYQAALDSALSSLRRCGFEEMLVFDTSYDDQRYLLDDFARPTRATELPRGLCDIALLKR